MADYHPQTGSVLNFQTGQKETVRNFLYTLQSFQQSWANPTF